MIPPETSGQACSFAPIRRLPSRSFKQQIDALADKIVEETAFYLALGASNLMHTIDPDVVVFGGGMIAAGEGFLERIRSHVRALAFPVPAAQTQIRYAQLGGDAGLMDAFTSAVATGNRELISSGPRESLASHLAVLAAERARLNGTVETIDPERAG